MYLHLSPTPIKLNIIISRDSKDENPKNFVLIPNVALGSIDDSDILVVLETPHGLEKIIPKGALLMRDDRRTRMWFESYPDGRAPNGIFFNVYRDGVFSAARGTEHMAHYAQEAVQWLRIARDLRLRYFEELFGLHTGNDAAVAVFRENMLALADGFSTRESTGPKAELRNVLIAASDVKDIRGRTNAERIPLMLVKVERLINETELIQRRWQHQTGHRTEIMDRLLSAILAKTEGVRLVTVQAMKSNPMHDESVFQNKEIARIVWPQWARELEKVAVYQPFGSLIPSATDHLKLAAMRMAEGEIGEGMRELKLSEAILRLPRYLSGLSDATLLISSAVKGQDLTETEWEHMTRSLHEMKRDFMNVQDIIANNSKRATNADEQIRLANFAIDDALSAVSLVDPRDTRISPKKKDLEELHDFLIQAPREISKIAV